MNSNIKLVLLSLVFCGHNLVAQSLTCPPLETGTCDISEVSSYVDFTEFEDAGGDASPDLIESSFMLVAENSNGLKCPEVVTRVYKIEDASEEEYFCSHEIEISDADAPIMDCAVDVVIDNSLSSEPPYSSLQEFESYGGFAYDNCSIDEATFQLIYESVEYGNGQKPMATREYQIDDLCGNYAICEQSITFCEHSSATLEVSECDSYDSPSGQSTWNVTGTYMDTIPNMYTCDSVITINLTIEDDIVDTVVDGMPGSLRMSLACVEDNAEISFANNLTNVNLDEALIIDKPFKIKGNAGGMQAININFDSGNFTSTDFGILIESGETLELENLKINAFQNIASKPVFKTQGELILKNVEVIQQ